MEIIFAMRDDYLTKKGGDTFQMLKTKEYIENLYSTTVKIITNPSELFQFNEQSIVHIFNIQLIEQCKSYLIAAKENNMKVVLSPIYWDLTNSKYVSAYYSLFSSRIMFHILRPFKWLMKNYFNKYHYLSSAYKKDVQAILNKVDMVLPNSTEEAEILKKQFGVQFNYKVVPNCIDVNIGNDVEACDREKVVMEVGRIEPIKNQLSIVKALMKNKEMQIVFIGSPNDSFPKYLKSLYKLSKKRGNVTFINQMSQEELTVYYKKAMVHVLPSFRESPGLVSLEALRFGANIVVSNSKYCPIQYYKFDQLGFICNPYSIKSIRKAIFMAINKKKDYSLEEYYEYFSYDNAAKITYVAYQSII